jgi:DNA-binding response OmpR family regulator
LDPTRNLVSLVIIDDNPRSLEFLSVALSRPGVQVFTASNPQEGLSLVSLYRPQVVLTDLIMPGMTGLDVLQRAKELDPAIEVIVMSARESGGSPSRALEQGAADYLQKPISLAVLRERVGKRLEYHIAERVKP